MAYAEDDGGSSRYSHIEIYRNRKHLDKLADIRFAYEIYSRTMKEYEQKTAGNRAALAKLS